jgi:hypothetical protein
MLIDKYLSTYDFSEFHFITVNAPKAGIYEKMLHCDINRSFLIRALFKLRGMPRHLRTIEDLTKLGFVKLDEEPGGEIVYGIVANSSVFNSCQPDMSPDSFLQYTNASIIKAAINFHIKDYDNSTHQISTETRIWCGNSQMRSRFKLYWFFIKPFSQLIRKSMLKQMKLQIPNVLKV